MLQKQINIIFFKFLTEDSKSLKNFMPEKVNQNY